MTGSLKEQKERNHSELSPVLVENVRKWLTKLKHHLDKSNYNVIEATGPEEGMGHLAANPVDLVLCDV